MSNPMETTSTSHHTQATNPVPCAASQSNRGGGGFLSAFAHVAPAPPPSHAAQTPPARPRGATKVPEHYWRHWERVPDILKNIPFDMTPWPSACLTPTREHEGRMFSESKCFSLIPRNSVELLKGPYDGITYCFVAKATTEIPMHILEVLYFFTACANKYGAQDRSPFVFPTDKIGLQVDRSNNKTVTGLYARGENAQPEQTCGSSQSSQETSSQQNRGFISVQKILESRVYEQPEEIRSPLSEIKMHLGFTGAEIVDEDDEVIHENFCVLMVTSPPNFFLWLYINESMMVPPKLGVTQYQGQMEFHVQMKSLLQRIMNYELVVNLGVAQQHMGGPDDYKFNPGGSLGVLTVLSQFQIPIKIFNVCMTRYPKAKSLKVLGMPQMTFRTDDDITSEWVELMRKSINEDQRSMLHDLEALQRYNMCKDKNTFENPQQAANGGWPLHPIEDDGTVTSFGLPALPIMLKYKANGSKDILNTNFDVWMASIGGAQALPDLVGALLRWYLVNTDCEDVFPEITHFLRDTRRADPVLLYQTYLSPEGDPFKAFMLVDSQRTWWNGFLKDLKRRRQGGASVLDAIKSLHRYVNSASQSLNGTTKAGGFHSKTITQMQEICETMDFLDVCCTGEHSIKKRVKDKAGFISPFRGYDSMYVAWHAFIETFREINACFHLNSINLTCAIEILVSMMLFKFGGQNDTWTYFFTTVMIMAGNGHFQTRGPAGPMTDRRKPNTTGADYTMARVSDIFTALYDLLDIPEPQRFLIPTNCTRFTPTAWEQASSATVVGDQVLDLPPSEGNDRPCTITELRTDSMASLIQYVFPRGPRTGVAMAINSCDPDKTGVRKLSRKVRVNQPNLVVMCTNEDAPEKKQQEEVMSCMVVNPVLPPGAGVEQKKRSRDQFQSVVRDANTGRARPLDDPKSVSNILAYTHIFASYNCGLINRLRSLPCEINPTTSAFMEWAAFYLQHYAEGVMDQRVRDNFSRIVQGYTTRALTLFVWVKTIRTLGRVDPQHNVKNGMTEATKDLLLDLHSDALPVMGVPVMLTCMMARSVHMGALLMTMLIAKSFDTPIVSWKNLNRFFTDEEPPSSTGTYNDEYRMIKAWIGKCLRERRFCPADDEDFDPSFNVSCYITDAGKESLLPLHETNSLFRFTYNAAKTQGGGGRAGGGYGHGQGAPEDAHHLFSRIAARIQAKHGAELFKWCHMGPEQCVYMYAIMSLTNKFTPDFRGFGSPHMFAFERHMRKMGFTEHLPGIKDYVEDNPPPFAREVLFKEGGQIKSVALGVNPFSLLAIVSFAREIKIHPSVAETWAEGFVAAILEKSPPGCTPGNICATRFFDANTKPIRMFIGDQNRPDHFLRPTDNTFPSTGKLALAAALEQYLPEDFLPCPFLPMIARSLSCRIDEIPASAVKVMPQIYGPCVCHIITWCMCAAEPVQPGARQVLLVPRPHPRQGRAGHLWGDGSRLQDQVRPLCRALPA